MKVLSFDVGMKNLAFCIFNTECSLIEYWKIIDITPKPKENSCATMVNLLDTIPDLLHVDKVLIEKQPSKNNKMRIIEGLLNAYFVIKGITNSESEIKDVVVYSAKHKLGSDTFKGKVNYSQRKKLGVYRTECFLKMNEQTEEVHETFASSKKKDDLADCLLQALSFCNIQIDCNTEQFCKSEKIIARKPSKKQTKSRYSKCNIKWIINEIRSTLETDERLAGEIAKNDRLKRDIIYWFKSVENCLDIII